MKTEKDIDRKFCDLIKGFATTIKQSTLGRYGSNGYPDRLVLLPQGRVIWVELKKPGGKLTALQLRRHEELKAIGHVVGTFDDALEAARFVGIYLNIVTGKGNKNTKKLIQEKIYE